MSDTTTARALCRQPRVRFFELQSPSLLRSYIERLDAGCTYAAIAREIGCGVDRVTDAVKAYRWRTTGGVMQETTARERARQKHVGGSL